MEDSHPSRRTADEVIVSLVWELTIDEVGFWQVVPSGRDKLRLEGPELDNFVQQALSTLFAAGAVPVRHQRETGKVWTWQKQFGSLPDEMAGAIVRDWVASGRP